jgi:hypothetical protein
MNLDMLSYGLYRNILTNTNIYVCGLIKYTNTKKNGYICLKNISDNNYFIKNEDDFMKSIIMGEIIFKEKNKKYNDIFLL